MATQPGLSTISHAQKYWLEQIPYTAVIPDLTPGQRTPVFDTLQGWNPTDSPRTYVEVTRLGVTQLPGLQLVAAADREQKFYYAQAFGPELEMADVRFGAVRSIGLSAVNTNATGDLVNVQINYLFTIWNEPIAHKVMRGYPLTADEQAIARRLGLDTSPVTQRGNTPYTIETIIRATYENRQIEPPLAFANWYTVTTQPQRIEQFQAMTNQLLVLRRIWGEADFDYGVQLTVDRDDNQAHVQINVASLDLERGVECFVPALRNLTFSLSAQIPPPYLVPIRAEVWVCSLSNILRDRMGLITVADMQRLMEEQNRMLGLQVDRGRLADAAADFDARVKAGLI